MTKFRSQIASPVFNFKESVLELQAFTCYINTPECDEKEWKLSRIMMMFYELKVELEAINNMQTAHNQLNNFIKVNELLK